VLDLSSDHRAAMSWASNHLGTHRLEPLNKASLKWSAKHEVLRDIKKKQPAAFCLFTSDLRFQSTRRLMILFGVLAGARQILFGDSRGTLVRRTRLSAVVIELPLLAVELLIGYLFLIPISWLLVTMLAVMAGSKSQSGEAHDTKSERQSDSGRSLRALYIRATLVPETNPAQSTGGLATHTSGFAIAAEALGNELDFFVASKTGLEGVNGKIIVAVPSTFLGATRTLFELSNNLMFTLSALLQLRNSTVANVDFLYQRYSRFNFTGAVLSIMFGLPLVLEFNGSEVWVSRHWDPVGQIGLLSRFEALNLSAADLVSVVSLAQRLSVIGDRVDPGRVLVNPNGVDPDQFRSDCGGIELRTQLGISDKIVVGFLGTFGPWHGAAVLAEAARLIASDSHLHFLFVGDGDQRSATEAHFNLPEGPRATFTGRVSRSEVPAYLDACDILVSPQTRMPDESDFFGSPTKLFEYMSMSKPVVASRLGQLAEVIADGENGMLVEPGDAAQLASAIVELAGDCSLRARLAAGARRRVEEGYTWRRNAQRVFERAGDLVLHRSLSKGRDGEQQR